MEHRAGWDATFSAPKSVSLTALVGGDDRVREAHRESVRTALDEMEKYAQARMGGNVPAQTTGQWAVAKFEHDSSRPVDGYAAPQLHTHAVIFNMTETAEGQTRASSTAGALQDAAVRDGGVSLGTGGAVAGAGLRDRARRARAAGDQGLHARVSGGVESAAAADRRAYGKGGVRGAGAAQIAAHQTRDAKQPLSHEEVRAQHQQTRRRTRPAAAARCRRGGAAARCGTEAGAVGSRRAQGVSYARERGMEREAVADERTLMRDALKHTMGEARLPEVRAEFERRVQNA